MLVASEPRGHAPRRAVTAPLSYAAAFVATLALLSGPARAVTVRAAETDLRSDTERMISYRHQEHMWQTADGALHLVFNRGSLQPNPGLALYSSFDGGATWSFMQSFGNTDDKSTADGQLRGDELALVHATADGSIMYAELHYDAELRQWSLVRSETAYSSAQWGGLNPALDVDAVGTVWCAFVARNRETNDTNIRVVDRVGGGTLWTDPGLVFGPTDHRSIERSARPLRTANGIGMIFTVREMTYWASRVDGLPDNSAWNTVTVFTGTPEQSFKDPYASHFSLVADAQNALHLTIVDSYDILYLRSPDGGTSWTAPVRLDDDRKAVYSQIGLANGKLAVAFSAQRGRGVLTVSADQGGSFSPADELALPPASPGVSYGTARVEMPTRSTGALSVLQQYEDNGVQRLMLFRLPSP